MRYCNVLLVATSQANSQTSFLCCNVKGCCAELEFGILMAFPPNLCSLSLVDV